jgi:hypothetical protein
VVSRIEKVLDYHQVKKLSKKMKKKVALLYVGLTRSNVLMNTGNHVRLYKQMFPRDEYEIDLYMVTDSIDVVELTRQMDAADIHVKRVLFTNKDTDDETMTSKYKTTQRTQYEPSMGHLYITSDPIQKIIGISTILESCTHYDYFIKTRNDLIFHGPVSFDERIVTHIGDVFFLCKSDKMCMFLDFYKHNGSLNDLTLVTGSAWDPRNRPDGFPRWILAPEIQLLLYLTRKANAKYDDHDVHVEIKRN